MSQHPGIFQQFNAHAMSEPARVLCVLEGGSEINYGAMSILVSRCAAKLINDGVGVGDRVAMQVDKSPEALALYLATQQIGAVILPLNTAYTPHELQYFLDDAEPTVFVCKPDAAESLRSIAPAATRLETLGSDGAGTLLDSEKQHREIWDGPGDALAAILYTSGTTGRSKGAMITRSNLTSNCAALLEAWEFTGDDRLIHALPIFHIHGLFVAANMVLAAGASMHFLASFNADAVLDRFCDATVLMGVPTFYTRLLSHDRLTVDLAAGMRLFVSGSAPLLATDHRSFAERTGHKIIERYGMTETGMNTTNPYRGERKAGTVGSALPGVEVRVSERGTGASLATGEIGVIEVHGPNVFAGYWRMPEKTAAEFTGDGFFITGDLGLMDDEGYLSIVGRDKDLVISGGYNIYPKEVEEVVDAFAGIVESAVIGVPHADLGESVVAVVVTEPGVVLDLDILHLHCEQKLARFKQPRAVHMVDELPRNTMGKVQKAQLRSDFAGGSASV